MPISLAKTIRTLVLSAPIALAAYVPAMAQDAAVTTNPDGTHTVTEVVGYNETVTFSVPGKDAVFARMDRDGDGLVQWPEFRDYVQMDNEYEAFLKMDKNRDKVIELNEYREFDKMRNRVLTESDGDNRVAVDREYHSTQDLPDGQSYTRFVPTKTQNFGTRDIN